MAIGTLLLAVAVLVLVALVAVIPLLDRQAPAFVPPTAREDLEQKRRAVVNAIREMDFDHKTGKLNDADYKQLRGEAMQHGTALLRELDQLKNSNASTDDYLEREIEKRKRAMAKRRQDKA